MISYLINLTIEINQYYLKIINSLLKAIQIINVFKSLMEFLFKKQL